MTTCGMSCNPLALACSGGDPTVKGHCVFRSHQWSSGTNTGKEAGMELSRVRFTYSHLDRHASRPQLGDALSVNARKGVFYADDTPLNASVNDGIHAWWGSAVMATWLKGHIQRRPVCSFPCFLECHNLCVWSAGWLCPAISRDALVIHNDSSD